jgi:hypothetical protein
LLAHDRPAHSGCTGARRIKEDEMRPDQPGIDVPRPEHIAARHRLQRGSIITLVILGWVALLYATDQPLLAAIQIGMIGLGAIGTAIVVALWRRP